MADVFISYKREERDKARAIAEAVAARGYDVWWDVELLPGDEFGKEIETVIDTAKTAIVLWSRLSVESKWVRGEARRAERKGILVPVSLDGTDPPLGLSEIHSQNLSAWSGKPDDPVLDNLLLAIEKKAGPPPQPKREVTEVSQALTAVNAEAEFWRAIARNPNQSAAEYQAYLDKYGDNGQFAVLANLRIKELSGSDGETGGGTVDKSRLTKLQWLAKALFGRPARIRPFGGALLVVAALSGMVPMAQWAWPPVFNWYQEITGENARRNAAVEDVKRKADEETKRLAAEEEAKRVAAEKEDQRAAAEKIRLAAENEARIAKIENAWRNAAVEEVKRKADEETKRLAAEEEAKRVAAEKEAQRLAAEKARLAAAECNRLAVHPKYAPAGMAGVSWNALKAAPDAAVAACRKAVKINPGDPRLQTLLGRALYATSDYVEEAVKWFRKAAEHGNANAQTYLGVMYQRGTGFPQSSNDDAFKWYRKAAEQGYAPAQRKLGTMYEKGHGVTRSVSEAAQWYRKAAEQGDSFAKAALDRLNAE